MNTQFDYIIAASNHHIVTSNCHLLLLIGLLAMSPKEVSAQRQAQATTTMENGRITNILLQDSGNDYTYPPSVSIIGDGQGATAIANVNNGIVQTIQITQPGSNYMTMPQVIIGPPYDYVRGLLGWWKGEFNAEDELNQNHGHGAGYSQDAVVGIGFSVQGPDISLGTNEIFNFDQGRGDFTIEAWTIPELTPNRFNPSIISKYEPNTPGGWDFYFNQYSDLTFANYGLWELSAIGGVQILNHVAVTKLRDRFTLYLNGEAVASTNAELTLLSNAEVILGRKPFPPGFIESMIDELAIYNRALTANEIKEIKDRGSQGKYARPLVTMPPTNTMGFLGGRLTFSPKVMGTPPLAYQWLKQGLPLANATNSSLTLTNVQVTDEGEYSLLVYNQYGSDTRPVAQLTVKAAQLTLGLTPKLTIEGVPGKTYAIQATTNLDDPVQWLTLTNITLAQPVEIWYDYATDTTQPDPPKRYYQVIVAP